MKERLRLGLVAYAAFSTMALMVACGGSSQGVACGAAGSHSHKGDDGKCYCDSGYDWVDRNDDGNNQCRSIAAGDVVNPADADAAADMAGIGDANPDEPAQPDVVTPTACITEALCAATSDCQQGERCNLHLSPPKCQKLYCAGTNQSCDPDQGDVLCKQGFVCVSSADPYCCKQACAGFQCGDDGCGGSCGTCAGAQEECVDHACAWQPTCSGLAETFQACGGNLVGTWGYQEICLPDDNPFANVCPGVATPTTLTTDDAVTFASDGTYTHDFRKQTWTMTVPMSCADTVRGSCVGLLGSDPDSPTCAEEGDNCVCTQVTTTGGPGDGTWSVVGNTVTTEKDGSGTPVSSDFCQRGGHVVLRGQITVSGGTQPYYLVLEKQ